MLALRLARGTHPLVLLRRLLVAFASAGVGFLLLCALGYAAGHPDDSATATLRLLWCLVPLAAMVHLAVAVARTDPSTRPRPGLSAIGLGPGRLTAIAAASTAVSCTLGSALALLVYLHLRGDITGMPFDGAAAELLAADRPMPLPAALTLLAVPPVTASLAAALALRLRRPVPSADDPPEDGAPGGLPWGVALLAAGLAVEIYAGRGQGEAGVFAGWALTALGLAVAGPGLTHLSGRLLQSIRPGPIRLIAGRALMTESRRIGRPLGVVCAVGSGAFAAATLSVTIGPPAVLGAVLVVACTIGTLATAALEARHARTSTTTALLALGAPPATLRTAAALRAGALLLVLTPVTWAVAALAAMPLHS
ncbi:hypothetical protein ACH44C_17670 [Streptomyces purpureus]|uniref:hypothetical protein n=1 Tax=Streptomyces purpureus TaxID=1951 RepID=UPI0037B35170